MTLDVIKGVYGNGARRRMAGEFGSKFFSGNAKCRGIFVVPIKFSWNIAQRLDSSRGYVMVQSGGRELREPSVPYGSDFDPEIGTLNYENTYFRNDSV